MDMQRKRTRLSRDADNVEKRRKDRKHISFASDGVKVRFVKPPPRTMNHRYWFTETQSIVKKGMHFEVEPDINISVDVSCRMQLTSISSVPAAVSSLSLASVGVAGGKKAGKNGGERAYLEIKPLPLFGVYAADKSFSRWLTVASVEPGQVEKIRVVMPTGSYLLRCIGKVPVQVFAQAWDVTTKLD